MDPPEGCELLDELLDDRELTRLRVYDAPAWRSGTLPARPLQYA